MTEINLTAKQKDKPQNTAQGGKDVNFLVRSTAVSVHSLNHAWKTKSNGRSARLAALTKLELLQNTQVQKTLKEAISRLNYEQSLFNAAKSQLRYAKKIETERCHRSVCRTRKLYNRSALHDKETPTWQLRDKKLLDEKKNLKNMPKNETFQNNAELFNKNKDTVDQNLFNSYQSFNSSNKIRDPETRITGSNTTNSRAWRYVSFPKLESGNQQLDEGPANNRQQSTSTDDSNFSLPPLDASSKFSIIRRTFELRTQRKENLLSQMTPWSKFLTDRSSDSKSGDSPGKKLEKIDIFSSNLELFNQKQQPKEQTAEILPMLDNSSFSAIDCDDYLHMRNRLDNLSPTPAVLSSKRLGKVTKTL